MTRTLAIWTRAVLALLVIAVLVIGAPWLLLVTVGNPIPDDGWSWSQPLSDGALLGVLAVLAWVFWAQMMLCLLVEVLAEVRLRVGRSVDWMTSVPGTFGGQQHAARLLVHAVIALGIGTTVATVPATPEAHAAVPSPTGSALPADTAHTTGQQHLGQHSGQHPGQQVGQQQAGDRPAPLPAARRSTEAASRSVEVVTGDTLWALAERHLGSGEAWRTIADLNEGRIMPDGERFARVSSIQPGWTLLLPAPVWTQERAGQIRDRHDGTTVVRPGDTLSGLAQDAYGDGDQWPRLYDANRTSIADPDLIYPGQMLQVPADPTSRAGADAPEQEPSAQPSQGAAEGAQRRARTHSSSGSAAPTIPGSTQPVPPPTKPVPTRPGLSEPVQQPSATPTATSAASGQPAPPAALPSTQVRGGHQETQPTLLAALLGGGGLLAGSALVVVLARRRRQFRVRRSGRMIAPTPTELVPAERMVRSIGAAGGDAAGFLDQALRDLSTRLTRAGDPLPEVAAARIDDQRLDLLFTTTPTHDPPDPWAVHDGRWTLSRDAALEATYALAPYPTLVALGVDADGATWLLDLEAAGLLQLLGHPTAAENLARFIAAELAINVWSDDVDVTVAGFADELPPFNPSRLTHHEAPGVADLVKTVRRVHEALHTMGDDVLSGRATGRGADTWMPTIILTTTGNNHSNNHRNDQGNDQGNARENLLDDVQRLLDELAAQPGRSAAGLVTIGDVIADAAGVSLTLDTEHHLTLLPWDVVVTANQLTESDARTLADLISRNDDEDEDQPMPPAPEGGPAANVSDAAGALLPELTEPRDPGGSNDSLLPQANATYTTAAATTAADLDALAPRVPVQQRERVRGLDDSLDADLADWYDPATTRPRLRLLGPVEVRAAGEHTAEVRRRLAFFTEIVAYLGTRDHGATPEQLAEALGVQTNTIHSRVTTIRTWLGTNPATGNGYVPLSTFTLSARTRGVPVYEVDELLTDADLFRRLRTRGQARGPQGIEDLVAALRLVCGAPFDQLRTAGFGWLAETPIDQYLTAGIVDVAHLVATHALSIADHDLALWASQTAIAAAPYEDKPRLDLAAVIAAGGHTDDLNNHLVDTVLNRTDDNDPPPPTTGRTEEILRARGWLRPPG